MLMHHLNLRAIFNGYFSLFSANLGKTINQKQSFVLATTNDNFTVFKLFLNCEIIPWLHL